MNKLDLEGGPGDDFIHGGNGKDEIEGDEGDDCLFGGTGKDDIEGDDGNDIIDGGDQADELDGDAGDDFIVGGNGPDDIEGGDGDDVITGGSGPDEIDGGDNDTTPPGGPGDTHNDFEAIDDVEDIETSEVGNPTDLSCNQADSFVGGDPEKDNPSAYVPDMSPPTIYKHGDDEIEIEFGSTYKDPGVYCDDDEDGEELTCVTDDSGVDTSSTGTYTVYYTTTDGGGNTATETRIVNVVGSTGTALNIAMICERDDCNNKKKDIPLRDNLVNLGHEVYTFDDEDMTWTPENYHIVVISESVISDNIEWLHGKTVPILTMEGANYDELALGVMGKSAKGGTTTIVIEGNHPITAGFTDGQVVKVTVTSKHLGFMVKDPSSGVQQLAHYEGSPAKAKILVADAGALLADGSNAPEKRVFFGAQFFGNLTPDGITLFDNAVTWMTSP